MIAKNADTIRELANTLNMLSRRADQSPLDYIRWLPPQQKVLSCPDRFRLFRAGNQSLGKTICGLAEVIYRCLGAHPYQNTTPPPIEAWVVCASWSQCISIQKKFYELCPKDEMDPDTVYTEMNGFRGKHPAVRFRNGSIVRFKTTQQGGLNLAGASVDFVLFDEPPKDHQVFSEIVKRVQAKNGSVLLTMTPINVKDLSWLRELCEQETVTDLHFPLTEENLIPIGSKRPLSINGVVRDQDWIDEQIKHTLNFEVPVRIHGEWDLRLDGNAFDKFDPDNMIVKQFPEGEYEILLGIDHGSGKNFSSYAVLSIIDKLERIYIIDEYYSVGDTTVRQDAVAIFNMVRRNGFKWSDIDVAKGDIPSGGGNKSIMKKSNGQLMRAIEAQMGIQSGTLQPRILTVKKGRGRGSGSVKAGCRYIQDAMLENRFFVRSNCNRLIESLQKWDWSDNEWKHAIDSLRYSLDKYVFKGYRSSANTPVYIG